MLPDPFEKQFFYMDAAKIKMCPVCTSSNLYLIVFMSVFQNKSKVTSDIAKYYPVVKDDQTILHQIGNKEQIGNKTESVCHKNNFGC